MPTAPGSKYGMYFQQDGKTPLHFRLPFNRLPKPDRHTNSYGGIRTRSSLFIFQLIGNLHSTASECKVQSWAV